MSESASLERTTLTLRIGMEQAAVAPPGGALHTVLGSCIGLALAFTFRRKADRGEPGRFR